MIFRTDIQALRGVAILLVLLHHAKIGPFQAGYLGVDIFFVISGYLITRMVKEGIEKETFSFAEFYFRRAKRLLPAAYVTFFVTALLSPFILNAAELNDFATQILGAVSFTGNFVLWRQAGYFEGAAESKPLLHVWSLAIEEQYYLLLPAAMVFVRRPYWLLSAIIVLIISLALCFVMMSLTPVAAFYLLPTRAWELGMGSVAALAALNSTRIQLALAGLFWPALVALIVIPILPIGTPHPGADAIIVCIATLVVILRRHEVLYTPLVAHTLAKVGNFSYSLYLAHWPVFAFMNNMYVGKLSFAVRVVGLAFALILGYLLYRYVELPARHTEVRLSRRLVGATAGTSLALVTLPFGVAWAHTDDLIYAQIRRPNHGFGTACEFNENFTPKDQCRNSSNPAILVWGDSYAMHLVPGIIATTNAGVIQATRSTCGPFVGLAPIDNARNNRAWAERCLEFNQSVMDYLATSTSIKVVVMSSPFVQYLDAAHGGRIWRSLQDVDGQLIERTPAISLAIEAMRKTVEKIRTLSKRVVIVAPPPSAGFDIGDCLERKASGKVTLGAADSHCKIPIAGVEEYQAGVLEFLKRLPNEAGVNVISFNETLCPDQFCAPELNGTFIYRDIGHFSYDGSRRVAEKMRLGELLEITAK